jgi:hypothetical protein
MTRSSRSPAKRQGRNSEFGLLSHFAGRKIRMGPIPFFCELLNPHDLRELCFGLGSKILDFNHYDRRPAAGASNTHRYNM